MEGAFSLNNDKGQTDRQTGDGPGTMHDATTGGGNDFIHDLTKVRRHLSLLARLHFLPVLALKRAVEAEEGYFREASRITQIGCDVGRRGSLGGVSILVILSCCRH